jgi:hypothetical protein
MGTPPQEHVGYGLGGATLFLRVLDAGALLSPPKTSVTKNLKMYY